MTRTDKYELFNRLTLCTEKKMKEKHDAPTGGHLSEARQVYHAAVDLEIKLNIIKLAVWWS